MKLTTGVYFRREDYAPFWLRLLIDTIDFLMAGMFCLAVAAFLDRHELVVKRKVRFREQAQGTQEFVQIIDTELRLEGLTDSGFVIDPDELRYVFLAATALKFAWIPGTALARDRGDALSRRWLETFPLLASWAEESLELELAQ